ncbi:MAG TPA: complex I NDUFA9 subunit family protein [Stellaceae bacterium]|nr:complex I NDUFA9 subunit family protein [Stellaceae bacterium]
MTILGASGFIGRSIVKRLAAQGALIAAVSRHASAARFLRPMGDVGQIALVDADLGNDAALSAVLAGADAVVNAVGILYERGRQTFDALHHRLPARLGALAKSAGVKRLVHISAIGADPASPAAYGRSKAAGESALHAGFAEAVILRPSIVFGPDDAFFNRFGALARVSTALPLIGGGTTRFQPVYVGDVADAALAVLEREDAAGRVFELGGPEVFTFRQLMELLLREIGRKRLLVPIPFGLAALNALVVERLPHPLITRDQLRMLKRDNVVAPGAPGLAELGITPTAMELVLPFYLDRFRHGGRPLGGVPHIVTTP